MLKISVAMCTYNGETFLQHQLDSIASQSMLPHELVVCDDGSIDGSIDVLSNFARRAPFAVRVVRNDQNLGFRANFMKCANLCEGDLIAFSDQDDVWHADKLARQAEYFRDRSVLLCGHKVGLINQKGEPVGSVFSQLPTGCLTYLDVRPFAFCVGFVQVMRRSLLTHSHFWPTSIDQGAPDKPMAHDQFFIFLALALGKVIFDEAILANYRQHDSNAYGANSSGSNIRRKLVNRFDEFEALFKGAKSREAILRGLDRDDLADRYRRFAEMSELRGDIYSTIGKLDKAAKLAQLIMAGGYLPYSYWHFTLAGLARDAFEIIR